MLCKIPRSIYIGCIVLGYAVFRRIHPKKSKLIPTIVCCKFKYICGLEYMFLKHIEFISLKMCPTPNRKLLFYNLILIFFFFTRIGYHDHWSYFGKWKGHSLLNYWGHESSNIYTYIYIIRVCVCVCVRVLFSPPTIWTLKLFYITRKQLVTSSLHICRDIHDHFTIQSISVLFLLKRKAFGCWITCWFSYEAH